MYWHEDIRYIYSVYGVSHPPVGRLRKEVDIDDSQTRAHDFCDDFGTFGLW